MSSPDQLIVSPVGEIPVLASTAQYLVQRVQRRRQTLHRDSLADRIRTGPAAHVARSVSHLACLHPIQDITHGTPSVHVTWEDDGTVIFVACTDLIDAGAASPVMAICTDLPVTGVPPGGLATTWQSMLADTWDESQPFTQLSLRDLRFEADRPTAGPAIAFTISGAPQSGPSATASSDL